MPDYTPDYMPGSVPKYIPAYILDYLSDYLPATGDADAREREEGRLFAVTLEIDEIEFLRCSRGGVSNRKC